MALYKKCSNGEEARSPDYRFTVQSKDDTSLLALKDDIKSLNKMARRWIKSQYERIGSDVFNKPAVQILRVQLMARGPRSIHAINDYGSKRTYDQSLPHRYATHFDVYVRPDSHAMWRYQYQLEHNLTPGQHAAIDKIERERLEFELAQARLLRENYGIVSYGTPRGTRYEGI